MFASGTHKGPEVSVRSDPSAALVWRGLNDTRLAAARLICAMQCGYGALWKAEETLENIEHRVVDRHGLAYKGGDDVSHTIIDCRRIGPMRRVGPRECIILSDVEELDGILGPVEVCGNGAARLVPVRGQHAVRRRQTAGMSSPEGVSIVALFEPHLLRQRECQCVRTDVKHSVHFAVYTMVA